MDKNLILELPDFNFSIPITLHWEWAPKTCQVVWDFLEKPIQTLTNHAVFAGYEIYLYYPAVPLELENHVVYPKPGQLLYYYLQPGVNADNTAHLFNLGSAPEAAAEIAIWYGEGSLARSTEMGVRGNWFASVDQTMLDEFFKVGHRTLQEGQQSVTLRRA